jgi:hypothetical protein
MPLKSGSGAKARSENIAELRRAGHPAKQAEAIAYAKQRGDQLNKAIAAGAREAEAQKQAKALMEGKYISGRDRAKLHK